MAPPRARRYRTAAKLVCFSVEEPPGLGVVMPVSAATTRAHE